MHNQSSPFIVTFTARGVGAFGGLLLSLIVARIAGVEGLGQFTVFLSLLVAVGIVARKGSDTLLIRAVAWASSGARDGTAVALLRHGTVRVVLPALVLGGIASGLLASGVLGPAFPGTVELMPLALVLLTVLALVAGYVKGRSRAWLAPLFEIGGISMLAALLLAGLVLTGMIAAEASVTIAFAAALVLLVVAAGLMILWDMPRSLRLPPLDAAHRADLRQGQVAFTLIALAIFLTQAGSFLLAGPFLSGAEIGLLRAAERLALLVSFPVLAIDPVISPRIVQLSRSGDGAELRRLIGRAMMLSGGIGAPMLLGLLIWPEQALGLMGAEFGVAAGCLRIMALAQFTAALLGPLAVLLNMSGGERAAMWINLTAMALGVALIPLLSTAMGATGFVIAYSAVIVVRLGLIAVTVLFAHVRQWQQAPLTCRK